MSAVQQWGSPALGGDRLSIDRSRGWQRRGRLEVPITIAPSRRAVRMRKRFVALLVLLILAGGAVLAGRALAQDPERPRQTVVTVQAGDTVSGLAQRLYPDLPNGQGVTLLQHANSLGGLQLMVGQRLVIPSP